VNTTELTKLLAREAEIRQEIANLEKRGPELQKQIEDFLGDTPIDDIPPEKQKIVADVQLKITLLPGTKRRLEVRLAKCHEELGAAYELANKEVRHEVEAAREEFHARVINYLRPLFVDDSHGDDAHKQGKRFLGAHEGELTVYRAFNIPADNYRFCSSFSCNGVVWRVEQLLAAFKDWDTARKALPKL